MYQNFEGLEPGEDIKNVKLFWVSPNPLGVLNQKNLLPTLIYQFEHLLHWSSGTPYWGVTHKGLKLAKRFTNLPFDFSGYQGKKGRACIKRKKILRIQLEFCIFYMFSLFHPGTHNLSTCQKIQATLCSDFGEVCEPFW